MTRLVLSSIILLSLSLSPVMGQPRITPPGQLPNDVRLEPLKDLNGYFPMTTAENQQDFFYENLY